jgi:hypothetical protein
VMPRKFVEWLLALMPQAAITAADGT